MSFTPYPKYKESGVEWLGRVPEHWEVMPLKRLATFTNGAAFKPAEWADSGYPIIRIENLNGGRSFNFFDGDPDPRHLVHDGDLLFGWSGNRGTSFGPFRWSSDDVCVLNQHIFKVDSSCIDRNDLYWMLKAVTSHVEDQAHGIIGMVHVTKGDLGAIKVPVPPSDEQRGISTFVDHETAKIDALIAEQQRLIELLQEKRQSVISHAVTKGLNPDAPMKDSGIEWLGEVPEHWEVTQLGYLASRIGSGKTPSGGADNYHDEGVLFLRSQNVYDDGLRLEDVVFISEATDDGMSCSRVMPGDILLNITGASLGRTCVVPDDFKAANVNQHVCVIRLRDTSLRAFLSLLLKSAGVKSQLDYIQNGAAREGLNFSMVSSIACPVPPALERERITVFLNAETTSIDGLMKDQQHAINLLQERRSALISAAVTGQIDVRGFSTGGSSEAA